MDLKTLIFMLFLISLFTFKESSAVPKISFQKNETVDISILTENEVKSIQVDNNIFLLNGDQLYQLKINSTQKYLEKCATLTTNLLNSVLMFDAVFIDDNDLVVILGKYDYFEIFEIPMRQSSDTKPIQRITTSGGFQGAKVVKQQNGEVILITATYRSNIDSMISVYKWTQSYFRQTYQKHVQLVNDFFVLSNGDDIFVFYSKILKTKQILHLLKLSDDRKYMLHQLDNIMLKFGRLFGFTFQNKVFVIFSPLKGSASKLFKINKNNQIFPSHELSEKFDKGIATNQTFVGLTENHIKVFCNMDLKCYGAILLKSSELFSFHYISVEKLKTEMLILNLNINKKKILRIIPVKRNAKYVDEFVESVKRSHFEETLSSLQSIILRVKNKLTPVKEQINHLRSKNSSHVLKHMKLNNSVVGDVKIVSKNLLTPTNLWKKVENIQSELSLLKAQFKFNRSKRDTTQNNILNVKKLTVKNIVLNDSLKVDSLNLRKNVSSNSIQIKHLNDVPWNDFISGLANTTTAIKGVIRFQSHVKISNLKTRKLNNLNTNKLFNLVDNQNVTSNIFINRGFFSTNITCNRLNGLDVEADIAKTNANNVINSRVTIKTIKILDSLKVSEDEEHLRHVFGTHFEDLQQIYTGRVVINGSLTLVNLEVDSDKLFLKKHSEAIDVDFFKDYWLQSTDQVFSSPVHFKSKITCPHLELKLLNNKNLKTYLKTSEQSTNGVSYLVINTTTISGNLELPKSFPTIISKLKSDVIEKNFVGTVRFRGLKTFQKILTSSLQAQDLNDINASEFIFKDDHFKNVTITGKKNIKFLSVHDSINVTKAFDIDFINNRSLADAGLSYQKKFKSVILDKPLVSTDLIIDTLNGQHFSDVLNFVDEDLNFKTTLVINGDVNFTKNIKTNKINELNWDDFRTRIVEKNDFENVEIHGRKSFKNIVEMDFVDGLSHINEINLRDLFQNILLKDRSQIITGGWSLGRVKFSDIRTSHVNHVPINSIVDRREDAAINSDFYVETCNVDQNVEGDFDYNFDNLFQKVKFTNQSYFNVVRVLNHAKWPNDGGNETAIDYLNKYGVRKDAEQIITGKVILVKPLINSAHTNNSIFKDFDFEYIAKDCLYKNSIETQYVTAATIFTRPVQIDTVKVIHNLKTSHINGFNILQFNRSTYRKDEPLSLVEGNIKFNLPVIIDHLVLENGKIDNVAIESFYCHNETNVVPPVTISDIHITNKLSTVAVNNYDFDNFLEKRITKRKKNHELSGYPTFSSLKVSKNINVKSLNNIEIDDIIWRTSKHLQNLKGNKRILGNLTVIGPSSVHNLNGHDIIEKAKTSVLLSNNYSFKKVYSDSVTIDQGINLTKIFNEFALEKTSSTKSEVLERLRRIQDFLSSKHDKKYIHYTNSYKIIWNEEPPLNDCKEIGGYSMHNMKVVVKKDKNSQTLFFNFENQTPFTKTTKNCNVTTSVINEKSVLNVWWRIPNINQEFYKTIALNLSGPIFVDVFEISGEFNAILLKARTYNHLYKFDKYQHEHQYIGEFEDVKILSSYLFAKKDSYLNVFNKYFEFTDRLDNVDIFDAFIIGNQLHVVLYSKLNSSLRFCKIGTDQRFTEAQIIPIDFKPLQIVNVKHGNNHFIAVLDGELLKIFKLTHTGWKVFTSSIVPDIHQIVPLSDDSLIFLLISQKFKVFQILSVI